MCHWKGRDHQNVGDWNEMLCLAIDLPGQKANDRYKTNDRRGQRRDAHIRYQIYPANMCSELNFHAVRWGEVMWWRCGGKPRTQNEISNPCQTISNDLKRSLLSAICLHNLLLIIVWPMRKWQVHCSTTHNYLANNNRTAIQMFITSIRSPLFCVISVSRYIGCITELAAIKCHTWFFNKSRHPIFW